MAPGDPHQKRRRGRPPGASKHADGVTERAAGGGPIRELTRAGTTSTPDAAPRKRGRPRKSIDPATLEASHNANNAGNEASGSSEAPKKRGRPPKVRAADPEEAIPTESRPRKRARAGDEDGLEDKQQDGTTAGRSKRAKTSADLPRAADQEEQRRSGTAGRRLKRHGQPDESPEQAPREPRRTNRTADEPKEVSAPTSVAQDGPPEGGPLEERSARRSQRERRSADGTPWWSATQPSPENPPAGKERPDPSQKRKRGRPSLAEVSVSRAQNEAAPSERDKPAKKKKRGRPPSAPDADLSLRQPTQAATSAAPPSDAPSNRRRNTPEEPEQDPRAAVPAGYRHLAARTRQVPRATIAAKWLPLDPAAIAAVEGIVADASRPVLHRLRDRDQRRAQAQAVLRAFAARLRAKLVKGMPFPAPSTSSALPGTGTTAGRGRGRRGKGGAAGGGHQADLDFETIVDAIAAAERALDPALHSVALLRAGKEREERALEREYEALRRLEANARAQAKGWREGMARGREHVLVGGAGKGAPTAIGGRGGGGGGDDGFITGRGATGVEVVRRREGGDGEVWGELFKDLQDQDELLVLAQQVASHMESMRSNLAPVEPVLPAIARSRAALQGVLCEHLDPDQYEQVLFG